MPLYEYLCACGHCFERFRGVADCAEPADCSLCGELARRVMSLPNVQTSKNVAARRLGAAHGYDMSTRAKEREWANQGIVLMNDREMDAVNRERGKAGKKAYDEILDKQFRECGGKIPLPPET